MASDLETAKAAYLANADYATEQNETKCKAFVNACRKLLLLIPTTYSRDNEAGGESYGFNPDVIRSELEKAEAFLASLKDVDSGGAGVVFISMEDYRD